MSEIRTWQVPGRVNLIGEHLDYNGGPSLPFAIDRHLTIKVRQRDDDTIRVWSTPPVGERLTAQFPTSVQPVDVTGWAAYVAGTAWALREAGHPIPGTDIVIESTLPTGAGLSSSAALTVGVACALDDLTGLGLDRTTIATLARRAENDFVGAPTGLMDQLAIAHGQAAHAVRTLTVGEQVTADPVPFALSDDLVLAVIDTGVRHDHGDGRYGERRAECEKAAAAIGIDHLANAGLDAMFGLDDDTLKARTRHVITETQRVKAATRAMGENSWEQLGTILTAGHQSLREDFEVSCAELDVTVETALEAGALGARMTGGGFGGSAIALVERARAKSLVDAVAAAFDHMGWPAPTAFPVTPSAGAHRLP